MSVFTTTTTITPSIMHNIMVTLDHIKKQKGATIRNYQTALYCRNRCLFLLQLCTYVFTLKLSGIEQNVGVLLKIHILYLITLSNILTGYPHKYN